MCISWIFLCYRTKLLFQPRQITSNFDIYAANYLSVKKPLGFIYHNWSIPILVYCLIISYLYLYYRPVPVLLHFIVVPILGWKLCDIVRSFVSARAYRKIYIYFLNQSHFGFSKRFRQSRLLCDIV